MSAEERVFLNHPNLVGELTDADLTDLNGEANAVGNDCEATITIQTKHEKSSLVLVRIAFNRPRVDNGRAVHTKKVIHITQNVVNIVRHLNNSPTMQISWELGSILVALMFEAGVLLRTFTRPAHLIPISLAVAPLIAVLALRGAPEVSAMFPQVFARGRVD